MRRMILDVNYQIKVYFLKRLTQGSLLLAIFLLLACSSERNTWTSKAFHNTTAHYNGYYYANEEISKIEKNIRSALKDDYNKVLLLFPPVDSSHAKTYDKELQEAIKMASIAIQRHPNSKWTDDCYLLVGKARLYSLDWGNAVQTFKFVNTKSEDPDARHRAIINLMRTFTEHGEFNNAQAAADFLEKEKMSRVNTKLFLLEKAYMFQMQGNHDYMVRNLAEAEKYLRKKDKPGRVYFIIGQVYQKLGFESEAYNFYKKCIATNPDFETDFYARLYMAQVTEISRSRSVNAARKSFKKLLKDRKNKDFKDKIYYEMGVFELKQPNLKNALSYFNQSVREGNNRSIDGEAFLRMGEVYFDTLKNYQLAQAYYDSAVQSLPPDYENYALIKEREQILDEFVANLNTIQWQDSLLHLSTLDSSALHALVDSVVTAKQIAEQKKAGKNKKRNANRINIEQNTVNVFGEDGSGQEGVEWYFGNPAAMSLGQSEFKRIWNDIALEDDWRRSLRSTQVATNTASNATNQRPNDSGAQPSEPAEDPTVAELKKITAQLPRTPEQKEAALKKIEDAYFNVGDIYYFKLQEKEDAMTYYLRLLQRFPQTEYEPEVLYKLYLISKELNAGEATQYANRLKEKYPESTYTKILLNPNYLAESSQAVEKQKAQYKEAYEHYLQGDYELAKQLVQQSMSAGKTSFTPQLELLLVLIAGKSEDIKTYQFQLQSFLEKYPEGDVSLYAKKLLDASREFERSAEKSKGVQYITHLETAHYFAIIHPRKENLTGKVSRTLEKFNNENFPTYKLQSSNLALNDEYIVTLIAELPNLDVSLEYLQVMQEEKPGELQNHKLNYFVITKDNFDIFYRTKGLNEYLTFFKKNYPGTNQ